MKYNLLMEIFKNYSKIADLDLYIDEKYPGAVLKCSDSLDVSSDTQREIGPEDNNCALVCIAKIILFYHDKGADVPEDLKEIYKDVLKIAKDNFRFTEKIGTFFTKIDNILKASFAHYGIKVKAKGNYLWNFYSHIKGEIDNGRPVIFNSAMGYYGSHSMICYGYSIYRWQNMDIKFIHVYDGWVSEPRYVDISKFAHNLIPLNGAMVSTVKLND